MGALQKPMGAHEGYFVHTGVLHQITVLHTKFFVTSGRKCNLKKIFRGLALYARSGEKSLNLWRDWCWCVLKNSLQNGNVTEAFSLIWWMHPCNFLINLCLWSLSIQSSFHVKIFSRYVQLYYQIKTHQNCGLNNP